MNSKRSLTAPVYLEDICMCFPRSALTLDIPRQSDAPAIQPTTVDVMMQRVKRLTPTIYCITVDHLVQTKVTFKA